MQTRLSTRPRVSQCAGLQGRVQRRVVRANVSSVAVDSDLKKVLLRHVAGIDRGQVATESQKQEIEMVISQLEASQAPMSEQLEVQEALQGKWQLVYTSVEAFRSSPFFWAFQEGLVGSEELASAIFKFTDAIPGATVGQAFQTFDFNTGECVSEVDLEVFPGAKGCVVTTSTVRCSTPPTCLVLTVENTRVARSNLLPFLLDSVVVPVKDVVEAVRGRGKTAVSADMTFLDGELRVARTRPDGAIFVYRKVAAPLL
uniref:Plastid lipid-associated protein/fibrillin conserved domain-containing protein n=1 Tax=Chlamydomonas leiostraca TaxID=1034604 RepID=A0A7S0WSZ6_9CHLO|mmetsp:Transcript_27274/g.69435  ORF Transcript_27274/g.69435 Transcript_27274/m.69435 type:complete len:257 (+) Transcript_27274:46-816(+)